MARAVNSEYKGISAYCSVLIVKDFWLADILRRPYYHQL